MRQYFVPSRGRIFRRVGISSFFIHLSVDGRDVVHFLAIINAAAVNIRGRVFVWIYLGGELLGHMV